MMAFYAEPLHVVGYRILGEGRAVPTAYSPMRRHAVLHPNSELSEKVFFWHA